MGKSFLVLEYQNNFADNMSNIAYANILASKNNDEILFENETSKRNAFEKQMSDFKIKCDYICSNRLEKLLDKSKKLEKIDLKKTKINKPKLLNINQFKIKDIPYISNDIKEQFNFKEQNFISNYDKLEKITQTNSIGIFIHNDDILNTADFDFINRSLFRLNKYIKKPVLYIFSKNEQIKKFECFMKKEIINTNNWKEEFALFKATKHKIIFEKDNSYSVNFWAAVLSSKPYSINIYDKSKQNCVRQSNWIGIY